MKLHTFRLLSLLVLLTFSLVACTAVVAPTATNAPNAAPTGDDPATDSPTGDAGTRTITDAQGTQITVPTNPQRIVTLSEQDLDGALALGLQPVGSVNGRGQAGLPSYLGDRVAGIESVGSLAEPSLEKIVALQPDLILVGGIFPQLEALLPQLREVAPVVVTYNLENDWKTAFRGTADALNQSEAANAFLAEYDERVQSLTVALGITPETEVSITRWMPDGPVVMAFDSFASRIARDLGFARPADQQIEGYAHSEPISLERLDLIDGEWLFIGTLNPDADAALAAAQENALFQQLGAVQAGRVAAVDGTIWTSRGGPLAAHIVLDDIAAAMQPAQ